MSLRICSFVVLAAVAAGLVACENKASRPVSPSVLASAPSAVDAQLAKKPPEHTVTLFDACDPETFNARLGAGACTRSGGVTFEMFIEQLTRHHSVGAWHFAPSNVTMRVGDLLVATNRGGEMHSFTEVEEFGGGKFQQLNELAGLTDVAPECAALPDSALLGPGASSSEEEEEAGVEKYQCCIHPWMRAEVRVVEK